MTTAASDEVCGETFDHDEEWDDEHTVWTCRRCGAEGFDD